MSVACDVLPEGRSVGRVAERAAPAELTIATWNIEHLRAQDGEGPNPRTERDFIRLQQVAEGLAADVIAVQEVEGEAALARVFDSARYAFHVIDQPGTQLTGFAYRRDLSVQRHPDYRLLDVGGLRYGADISVRLGSHTLRLLAVHLKASCVSDPLSSDTSACQKFRKQVPALEAWIDQRAREGVPFMVLGDFNRRFFARGDGDEVWRDLDDGDPVSADLTSPTMGQRARCWNGRYPHFIDHLVMGPQAAAWQRPGSFVQHLYEASPAEREGLSDHCPLSLQLEVREAQVGAQVEVTVGPGEGLSKTQSSPSP